MRITRENMEELGSVLQDLSCAVSDIEDAVETWLDKDANRDARADAREQLETDLRGIEEVCVEVLKVVAPKRLV